MEVAGRSVEDRQRRHRGVGEVINIWHRTRFQDEVADALDTSSHVESIRSDSIRSDRRLIKQLAQRSFVRSSSS
ncbi:tryptamine hydroxycinnamoyltransferase 2-like [Iris pallida]|uniref:Tryptamine hydroxycinnamoyltransferase 2-like n=1 Tax=Iris pallida TaxID=29817 RepID=A0AAX6EI43_IRIPA|nr:tryptamine hydroxycinnamoyltransferase 2-like [Iris pallida]KAJ6803700.1 tryptamine hydroxycinnamoyltransferase 2-like [Iris pallida]KAJ6803701.1 tryptamine hydroxycinnamoyltransferase 2-like [Iris pallida]KAJ6807052.1 tryptamine hydroxycinnamoyltransferase 2-like [Iris pallida]KAJ6810542.1 tryptamine hydroxycinnamoyltransferase 2-like [Iris pallida]